MQKSKASARRAFLSTWLLEFSVLWAVFPLLDQLLSGRFDVGLMTMALVLSALSLLAGILLVEETSE